MDKAGMAHCPVLGVSVQLASPDNSSVPQAVAADTPRLWGEPDTDCTAKTQLPSATVITPAPSLLPCSPEPQPYLPGIKPNRRGSGAAILGRAMALDLPNPECSPHSEGATQQQTAAQLTRSASASAAPVAEARTTVAAAQISPTLEQRLAAGLLGLGLLTGYRAAAAHSAGSFQPQPPAQSQRPLVPQRTISLVAWVRDNNLPNGEVLRPTANSAAATAAGEATRAAFEDDTASSDSGEEVDFWGNLPERHNLPGDSPTPSTPQSMAGEPRDIAEQLWPGICATPADEREHWSKCAREIDPASSEQLAACVQMVLQDQPKAGPYNPNALPVSYSAPEVTHTGLPYDVSETMAVTRGAVRDSLHAAGAFAAAAFGRVAALANSGATPPLEAPVNGHPASPTSTEAASGSRSVTSGSPSVTETNAEEPEGQPAEQPDDFLARSAAANRRAQSAVEASRRRQSGSNPPSEIQPAPLPEPASSERVGERLKPSKSALRLSSTGSPIIGIQEIGQGASPLGESPPRHVSFNSSPLPPHPSFPSPRRSKRHGMEPAAAAREAGREAGAAVKEGLERAAVARAHFEAAARRHPGGEAGGVLQAVLAHITVQQRQVLQAYKAFQHFLRKTFDSCERHAVGPTPTTASHMQQLLQEALLLRRGLADEVRESQALCKVWADSAALVSVPAPSSSGGGNKCRNPGGGRHGLTGPQQLLRNALLSARNRLEGITSCYVQALLALDEVVMLLPAHQPRGARHRATCSSATSRSRTVHGTLPVSPTGVDALPVGGGLPAVHAPRTPPPVKSFPTGRDPSREQATSQPAATLAGGLTAPFIPHMRPASISGRSPLQEAPLPAVVSLRSTAGAAAATPLRKPVRAREASPRCRAPCGPLSPQEAAQMMVLGRPVSMECLLSMSQPLGACSPSSLPGSPSRSPKRTTGDVTMPTTAAGETLKPAGGRVQGQPGGVLQQSLMGLAAQPALPDRSPQETAVAAAATATHAAAAAAAAAASDTSEDAEIASASEATEAAAEA